MDPNQATNIPLEHHHRLLFPQVNKLILYPLITLLIGLSVGIGFMIFKENAKSQKETVTTVTVIGKGRIEAPIDKAKIYTTITVSDSTAEKATAENRKIGQDFKNALEALGIGEKDIYIYNYNTSSQLTTYSFLSPTPSATLSPYKAVSNINITLNKKTLPLLDRVLKIIEQTPDIKLTTVAYALQDASAYEDKAYEMALANAKKQIDTIAKTNNVKISRLVSITDLKKQSKDLPSQNTTYEKTVDVASTIEIKYELDKNFLFF